MPTGTVKWFDTQKGYGFLKPDDGGNDIFVHLSEVKKSGYQELQQNQRVEFQMAKSSKTQRMGAASIKVIG